MIKKIKKFIDDLTNYIYLKLTNITTKYNFQDRFCFDICDIKKVILYFVILVITLITNVVLYISNNENKKINFNDTKLNDFVYDDKIINLDLSIRDELYNIDIKLPKKEPDANDIVDRLIYAIDDNVIKGDNKSLKQINSKLNLVTLNDYNAKIYWDTKNGTVNLDTGEIVQPFKGQGDTQDILYLIVEYENIKKIKEFKITIIENNMTYEEYINQKVFLEIQDLNKEDKLFEKNEDVGTIINKYDDIPLEWYVHNEEKENHNFEIMFLAVVIFLMLTYNELHKKSVALKEEKNEIEILFSDFAEFYTLLYMSNFNLSNAILYINSKYNNDNLLKKYLIEMSNQITLGMNPYYVLDKFSKHTDSLLIKRFVTLLISNLKSGNSNMLFMLRKELKDMNINKKNVYEQKAQKNNIKELIPLMMILISTMIMIVYPAIKTINF